VVAPVDARECSRWRHSGRGVVGVFERATGAQAADAPIGVQTPQMFVTVENKAGLPLVDVDVSILPVGGPIVFTKSVA